jgi:membrane dipeptidase
MRFFDAHCDAVMHAYDGPFDFVNGEGRGHMDLPRLLEAGHRAQVFAIFAARSRYAPRDLRILAEGAIASIGHWAESSAGRMVVARTASDLRIALDAEAPALAGIIGLEGADPLPNAGALAEFFRLGVRLVIPAWDDNQFSGSSTGGGGPLTGEGHKLVDLARALRVMVDVSHLSDAAFEEVREHMQGRPFIASHSNCRSLCPAPRNLTDAQIKALAGCGGVMGINLAPDFLDPSYLAAWDAIMASVAHGDPATRHERRTAASPQLAAIPRPSLDRVAEHVVHAMNVGGEECIGLGGDMDGISFTPERVTGVESYPLIVDVLVAAGLTERQVELVCWRNMARAFMEVLP